MQRHQTKAVMVGGCQIGGQARVVIQTMLTTKTEEVEQVLSDIQLAKRHGAELVRVSLLDQRDAAALKEIMARTALPVVADIHFDYKLALTAIQNGVNKIRINPGNIPQNKLETIILACKEKGIPIRIGINGGSLESDLQTARHVSAEALVASAARAIDLCNSLGFDQIVLSLKSSDVKTTIEAYRLASAKFDYPLHLGVSEAGPFLTATIKSAAALGMLLDAGIGDTIRISITAPIIEELKVAKILLKQFNLYALNNLIACPTCGRTQMPIIEVAKEIEAYLLTCPPQIAVAVMGCAVNGPGEAKSADIGLAGGHNCFVLFKHGKVIGKVNPEDAVKVLKAEINAFLGIK